MKVIENFSNVEELSKIVDENKGVITTTMRALRDAHGADRLGIHVRSGLSRSLRKAGLGHQPRELPDSQEKLARIYRRGGPVDELIEAVDAIDPQNDEILRERAGNDAADIIQKIRELVE